MSLELILGGRLGGGTLDGAQHRDLRGDRRDDVVLRLLASLVLRLKILQESVQIIASLLDFGIERFNFGSESFGGERLLFLDELGLLFVAEIDVFGAARRAELLGSELVERLEVTAALVRITRHRGGTSEILEGRVTLNAILLAEAFLLRAVNVADDHIFVVRERFTELLPRRRERLAVTAPARTQKSKKSPSVPRSIVSQDYDLGHL